MVSEIEKLLPHRRPFLFVDRLEKVSETEIVGIKTFREDEFFFPGHFPGFPVVPGVILIETLAQCGGAGVKAAGVMGAGLFFLVSVEKVKFRRQVRPGDEVRMVIQNLRVTGRSLKQKGQAYVNGEVVAEAEWLCLVGEGT